MRPPEPANPPSSATAVPPVLMATPMMPGWKGGGKGKPHNVHGFHWKDSEGGWHWYQPVTWMNCKVLHLINVCIYLYMYIYIYL